MNGTFFNGLLFLIPYTDGKFKTVSAGKFDIDSNGFTRSSDIHWFGKFTILITSNVCLRFYAETKSSFLMQNTIPCQILCSQRWLPLDQIFPVEFPKKIWGLIFFIFYFFVLAGTPYTKTKETYTYRTIDNNLFITLVAFAGIGILYALFCLLTLVLNFKKK